MDPRNSRVKNLIESIKSFKAFMTFKNLDFDADKAAQYLAARETMAAIYCDDETSFGPTEAPNWRENFGELLPCGEKQKTNKLGVKWSASNYWPNYCCK